MRATLSNRNLAEGRFAGPSINVRGANDRINVGVVGAGSAGLNHLMGIHEMSKESNTAVVSACDLFDKRRAAAARLIALSEDNVYVDYRKMLERKDIDAIVVATHDPLHAQVSLDALEAGKHVYCERPFTRYLGEAFEVFDRVKSTGMVFQLGLATCSAGAWDKCAELFRAGKLGALVSGQATYCRNGGPSCDGWGMILKESTAMAIDWEKWLGPLKQVPFSALYFHQWRLYREYSAGLLACQAPPRLHAIMLGFGQPEFPLRVNCVSTQRLPVDRFYPGPAQGRVPAHVELLAEFPAGFSIQITCSWMNARGNPLSLHAHKATILAGASGDRVELVPESEFSSEVGPEVFPTLQPEDIRVHERNWFDCIRSGKRPNGHIDLAIRGQTVLSLAEMSDRLKITCLFDEKTRKVTDGSGKQIALLSYSE
jgi:predicted dehydrogenase